MKVGPLGVPRPLGLGPFVRERSKFAQRIDQERNVFVNNCIETVDADDLLTNEQINELGPEEIQQFEREACENVANMLGL